ncbi:MAG: 2-oxoacid:acceptor oxidoreductase subunit alpha, partial [Bacteroidia bacterium]
NPAALLSNLSHVRQAGTIILDEDSFSSRSLKRAGYETDPREDGSLDAYQVIQAPVTNLTREALSTTGLDQKSILRARNMFVLGLMYWMFDRPLTQTEEVIARKFGKTAPDVAEGNIAALQAGYNYGVTTETMPSLYKVPAARHEHGLYRHISGNIATAWGLMAAREKLGLTLYYGSYPITPASDILHELAKYRQLDVITVQAEDEIAAVCSAIGASYAGHIGVTASSGPGIALKGEAMGLALMAELPLVIVNVQRAGPSTGLPTKTEQGDLTMSVHGRNGDSPAIVLAPGTPSQCFDFAYQAVKLAVEHMTPVILLTDAYLANGSEPWRIPEMAALPEIQIPQPEIPEEGESFEPYKRDPAKLSRYWAKPGMEGLEHRIGGLEKELQTGNVSYDPANHEAMVRLRAEKVARVANYLPELEVFGPPSGDLLLIGWGSTYGALRTAVEELLQDGHMVSLAHFNYINPLPSNTAEIFKNFDHLLVSELNLGQFARFLRGKLPQFQYDQYNKIQGLPFTVSELKEKILKMIG